MLTDYLKNSGIMWFGSKYKSEITAYLFGKLSITRKFLMTKRSARYLSHNDKCE